MNSDSSKQSSVVLMSTEVELYVGALQAFGIEEIASRKWFSQHEIIEKLNMQAILSASANETEYVKDALLSLDKMPVLMHDLIATELWAEKVFSKLFEIDFHPKNSFIIYLTLYHEATLVNLLETVLFHAEVCQALGDCIFDLVDYIQRKMADQIRIFKTNYEKTTKTDEPNQDPMKELTEQSKGIQFDIFIKLFSILRYIVDNLSNLPLGVTNRILTKHDFIMMLVQAVELSVWSKTDKDGKYYKYVDHKWKCVPLAEKYQLSKVEGQIWIALYELLLNPHCVSKYDYTEYKKNQILKLRSHMNEVLIDQIPNLANLQRFLEQLAVSQPPAFKSELIIEQVPEIYDHFVFKYKGKWKKMARSQADTFLDPSDAEIREKAQRWTETYNSDVMEALLNEPAKCAECGQPAPKRCSRCQNEWYCRRECQVKNWSKHKKICDLIVESQKSLNVKQKS